MDRRLAIILGALPLVAAGAAFAAPAAGAGPFAFSGARLGMTLAQWRALPYPGPTDPRARPMCSNQPAAARVLPSSASDRRVGAVVCGYFADYGRYLLPEGIRPGPKRRPVQVRYVFVAGRLSEIRYLASRDSFDRVTARLKAAYGPPQAVVRDRVQTPVGKLDQVRMTWAAPRGSAMLTDPYGPHLNLAVVLSGQRLKAAPPHS